MKIDNPISLACEIAVLLNSDPVAAAQIKEHLKPRRLVELLDLHVIFEEDLMPDEEAPKESATEESERALITVLSHYSKAEVLAAFRRAKL